MRPLGAWLATKCESFNVSSGSGWAARSHAPLSGPERSVSTLPGLTERRQGGNIARLSQAYSLRSWGSMRPKRAGDPGDYRAEAVASGARVELLRRAWAQTRALFASC